MLLLLYLSLRSELLIAGFPTNGLKAGPLLSPTSQTCRLTPTPLFNPFADKLLGDFIIQL